MSISLTLIHSHSQLGENSVSLSASLYHISGLEYLVTVSIPLSRVTKRMLLRRLEMTGGTTASSIQISRSNLTIISFISPPFSSRISIRISVHFPVQISARSKPHFTHPHTITPPFNVLSQIIQNVFHISSSCPVLRARNSYS
jgi:hypothetical protein